MACASAPGCLRCGGSSPPGCACSRSASPTSGVAVAAARRAAIRGLGSALAIAPGWLPQAELALDGTVEGWLDEMSALEAEARFAATLAATRGADGDSGTTATGPHRSDLVVRDRATGRAARDCSTGGRRRC